MNQSAKEPEIVKVHANLRDDNGKDKWFDVEIALTDDLLKALRGKEQETPKKVDYNLLRLNAYRDFLKSAAVISGDISLDKNGKQVVYRDPILVPREFYQSLEIKLKEYEKLEKGA